jgi:HK97 family phage prohead protease
MTQPAGQHRPQHRRPIDQSYQRLELKSLAEDGTFEGFAAAYGNVDTQGNRIEPGAFKAAEGQQIPLLFAHKTDEPVGTVTETPQGPWVKGKLLLHTVAGREAYTRLKAGLVKALSVGFQLPSDGFSRKDGIRVITRAVLKEISLVIFGANALAAVAAVKEETPPSSLTPLLQWLRGIGETMANSRYRRPWPSAAERAS